MLNSVRRAGALTCGDVFALGMNRIRKGIPEDDYRFAPLGEEILRRAIATIVDHEIPEDQAKFSDLPNVYERLEHASAAVLLPVGGPEYLYDHYHQLDFNSGPLTVGDFASPDFEARLIKQAAMNVQGQGPVVYGRLDHVVQASQHTENLLAFRTDVVLPAIQQFDALKSQNG